MIFYREDHNCTSVETIKMPTKLVGCPAFGGPNLNDIFITTSTLYLDLYTGKCIKRNCRGGSLLSVEKTKWKGFAGNSVRLDKVKG